MDFLTGHLRSFLGSPGAAGAPDDPEKVMIDLIDHSENSEEFAVQKLGNPRVAAAMDRAARPPDKAPPAARGYGIKRTVQGLLPPGREILAVLGAVVFAVHSWSVGGFLYKLPSLLLKYRTGEILVVFCYHMAFAFLESLCVTAVLLGMSALLPAGLLRTGFVYKGLLVLIAGCAAAIFLQYSYVSESFAFEGAGRGLFWARVAAGFLIFLGLYAASTRSVRMQKALTWLAEQISVMLFVYLPLDVVGLLTVGVRLLR